MNHLLGIGIAPEDEAAAVPVKAEAHRPVEDVDRGKRGDLNAVLFVHHIGLLIVELVHYGLAALDGEAGAPPFHVPGPGFDLIVDKRPWCPDAAPPPRGHRRAAACSGRSSSHRYRARRTRPTWSECRWLANALSTLDQSGRSLARFSIVPLPMSNRNFSPLPSSTYQPDAFCCPVITFGMPVAQGDDAHLLWPQQLGVRVVDPGILAVLDLDRV